MCLDSALGSDDVLYLAQKPRIVAAGVMHFIDTETRTQRLSDDQESVRRRLGQGGKNAIAVVGNLHRIKPGEAGLHGAQGFL